MAKFEKGGQKKGGRKKGTPNKLTRTVKETVLGVFNELQQHPTANLLSWAEENPKDFYLVAAKLIPTELNGQTISKIIIEGG